MEFENLIKLIDTVSASNLTGFKYEAAGVNLSMKGRRKIPAWGRKKRKLCFRSFYPGAGKYFCRKRRR